MLSIQSVKFVGEGLYVFCAIKCMKAYPDPFGSTGNSRRSYRPHLKSFATKRAGRGVYVFVSWKEQALDSRVTVAVSGMIFQVCRELTDIGVQAIDEFGVLFQERESARDREQGMRG